MRLPIKILIPIVAIVLISSMSFASTFVVTSNTVNGEGAFYTVDSGIFTVGSSTPMYQVAAAADSASGTVTWASAGTMYVNAVTAGDWVYSGTLTVSSPAATTYTLTVEISQGGAAYTSYTIGITTTTSSTGTMTFVIDLGTTITAPVSVVVSA
jgi:hypothetical protein